MSPLAKHLCWVAGFPYFQLLLVVPCTLLTMLGVSTKWTATFLVMDMMRDSTGIILEGL